MRYPNLEVHLDRIEHNARIVTDLCRKHGIAVAGVTKVLAGSPKVARALLRGGAAQIADSRLENIRRLRDDALDAEIMLLRIPMLSEVEEVVRLADISLNSELAVVKALSEAAEALGTRHRVIVMVDTGDLREGILPQEALSFCQSVVGLPGVELCGVGTNLMCFGGVQPGAENMEMLAYIATEIRARLGIPLPVVSAGNSASLQMVAQGRMPKEINHLRVGHAILCGGYADVAAEGADAIRRDTCVLHAEIVELKEKPSAPYGTTGKDAFGTLPHFEDRGVMKRAILGVGREDIVPQDLRPADGEAEILGASSDHMMVDITRVPRQISVGDELAFVLDYGALLAAVTSPYVYKRYRLPVSAARAKREVMILGAPLPVEGAGAQESVPTLIREQGLRAELDDIGLRAQDRADLSPRLARGEAEREISDAVAEAVADGQTALVLGGPHWIVRSALEGLRRVTREFGLICFDAHGDLITTLLGEGRTPVGLENVALIGVRDLTAAERRLIGGAPVTVCTMEDIDKLGMLEVVRRSIEVARNGTTGLHVSLDMDFVDQRDAPGVAEPEPGGVSYREAHLAMELIAEQRCLLSADLTEIDPDKDPDGRTTKLAAGLLGSLLGKRLLERAERDRPRDRRGG